MPDDRPPEKIVAKLYAELARRRPVIDKAQNYYDGAHNLAFAGEKFLAAFGGLFRAFADNWCGIVANAPEERMQVNGFRVNQNPKADDSAKKLWEQSELDLQSSMGHLDGFIAGAFFVTVWPGEEGDQVPEITVESAKATIVECHPKIRKRRTAALRSWVADDGFEHCELFLPDEVYLYRSRSKVSAYSFPENTKWVIEDQLDTKDDLDASGAMPNPFGVVPVVEFLNRPRLTRSPRAGFAGHSELASIMPLQDAVNKLVADLLVASEHTAYPQRWLTGYEPEDVLSPETGKPTGATKPPDFKPGPGNLWWLESENAAFGSFDAANLDGYAKAIELVVQHIASISATPPHYLNASADRLSGESIKSAESGLVSKVTRISRGWASGWEEVMRLAGKVAENTELAEAEQMETIWRDPETRTEAEHVDALGKKAQMLNVPAPQLWEEAGYTPEQIARFPAMRAQMQLEGMAANAAQRARTATEESARLNAQLVAETGGLPANTAAA